jgi:diketogulonate reductase-like aldo/keto reductase
VSAVRRDARTVFATTFDAMVPCDMNAVPSFQLYKNEHIVGRAIARAISDGIISRSDLFVTGKLAPTQMQPEAVEPAVRKSLGDLFGSLSPSAAFFDLFITHWPYAVDPSCTVSPAPFALRRGYSDATYLSVWRAMEAAVDAGLVRSLGCSNMTPRKLHALCAAARIQPSNVQVELHPFLAQPRLVNFCKRRGIVVTGYSPLGSPGRPAAYRAEGDPDVLGSPVLQDVAARVGRSPAQVALRWAVQVGGQVRVVG